MLFHSKPFSLLLISITFYPQILPTTHFLNAVVHLGTPGPRIPFAVQQRSINRLDFRGRIASCLFPAVIALINRQMRNVEFIEFSIVPDFGQALRDDRWFVTHLTIFTRREKQSYSKI
jgi:hypothetical protein